jgi:chorismate--pyruvate lyase
MCHNFSVKIHCLNHYQRANWLKKPMMSGQYHHWLIEDGSLTMRLQHRYADFAVKPALLAYAKPFLDEAMTLNISPRTNALIREVLLMSGKQAVVFAHSVLPRASLRGAWNGLCRLGNKPLGATLFANPKVKRTPLSYKKLTPNHVLYKHATEHLMQKPSYLWARCSVFSLNCANIMVTEVFLPQLLET